jgi:predicted secreted protein
MPAATPIARPSINTLLQRGDGASPENFTTVANVSSIKGFTFSATVKDVTSHSTGVPWRQKIPTLLDPGDLTADIWFIMDSVGHRALLNDFANRVTRDWRLVEPDTLATVFECPMFISKLTFDHPVDGVTTAQITLTATGDPNFPTTGGNFN